MVENRILRKNAVAQLGGNIFDKTWLMVMLAYLICSAITGAASMLSFIVAGPLLFGINRICINTVKGKRDVDLAELFDGFKENFSQSLLLYLLMSIFTFLWSLLLIIPGMIKSYSYAMAPYILQDDPTKDWKQCMDESKEMMKGHKGQLFCLDFSFIGWYIVGFLCCCVGIIFVYPYHVTARANFYMARKAMDEPHFTGDTENTEGNEDAGNTGNEGPEPVDPFQN